MVASSNSSRRRRVRLRLLVVAVALLALLPMAISLGSALTAPGGASLQIRAVDWARDHGGAGIINQAENIYYSLRAPADSAPPTSALPASASRLAVCGAGAPGITLVTRPGRARLPDEGCWHAGRPGADGRPSIATAWFRPDPDHASVVVGVAWLRQASLRFHLVAGTRQPDIGAPGPHAVDPARLPGLVAIFNSGWRMSDIRGGFLLAGKTYRPLVTGESAAVIDADGRLRIGQWGRDVRMTPATVAVRQNLRLIVDGGRPAEGLDANLGQAWGSPKNQYQYTDRSALGVDAHDDLIYVAGNGLTLHSLAVALLEAGAVRGMELDIHPGLPMLTVWAPNGNRGLTARRLVPMMTSPLDRYLAPEQRDFFYAELR